MTKIFSSILILLVLSGCAVYGPPPPGTARVISQYGRQAGQGYDYQHGSREFHAPDGRLLRRGEVFRKETPHGSSTIVEDCQWVPHLQTVWPPYGRPYEEEVFNLECREVLRIESYRDPPRYDYSRPPWDGRTFKFGGGGGHRRKNR